MSSFAVSGRPAAPARWDCRPLARGARDVRAVVRIVPGNLPLQSSPRAPENKPPAPISETAPRRAAPTPRGRSPPRALENKPSAPIFETAPRRAAPHRRGRPVARPLDDPAPRRAAARGSTDVPLAPLCDRATYEPERQIDSRPNKIADDVHPEVVDVAFAHAENILRRLDPAG